MHDGWWTTLEPLWLALIGGALVLSAFWLRGASREHDKLEDGSSVQRWDESYGIFVGDVIRRLYVDCVEAVEIATTDRWMAAEAVREGLCESGTPDRTLCPLPSPLPVGEGPYHTPDRSIGQERHANWLTAVQRFLAGSWGRSHRCRGAAEAAHARRAADAGAVRVAEEIDGDPVIAPLT